MNKEKKRMAILPTDLPERLAKLVKEIEKVSEQLRMVGGDISDNADWKILNEKLENLQKKFFNERKIFFLTKDKAEPEILITYQLLESGEERKIKLTRWTAEPDQGKISVASPLGLALVDKKIGEISEVQTKEKSYKIKIINIK
jgi:transcription elongation GreA/GreB family factor